MLGYLCYNMPMETLVMPQPEMDVASVDQPLYAVVAVDQRIDSELTYTVPSDLLADVHRGSRVTVPLGRGNHSATGTVIALTHETPAFLARKRAATDAKATAAQHNTEDAAALFDFGDEDSPENALDTALAPRRRRAPMSRPPSPIKDIKDVLSEVLPVPVDLLDLASWISRYYAAPVGVTLSCMVPAAVKRNTRLPTRLLLHLKAEARDVETFSANIKLSPKARQAYGAVAQCLRDGPREEAAVMAATQLARPMLRRLAEKGIVRFEKQIVFPEMPAAATMATPTAAAGAPAEPHPAAVSADPGASAAAQPDADAHADAVAAALAAAIPPPADVASDAGAFVLSPEQQTALEAINAAVAGGGFCVKLIHGVTGSGKTEVYIRAIEEIVKQGRRAIVLVPEISLTPQTVRRFTRRFARVAVLHSGLRDSQRHQHWHAIASGWAQVIVGARSAIFAPADNIGLIVVDEEHDGSYKQDSNPRYHGRDVAIRRGQMLNVPVLLGSATPALETWHNARGGNGHYQLLSMRTRPSGTQMPQVLTVDMKEQSRLRRGLHILSTVLEHHLKQTLDRGKQALLLLNRRGYAHYCMCPRCEWVLMCENCDATMVVHRTHEAAEAPAAQPGAGRSGFEERYGVVQCHYCLTSQVLPGLCPLCKAKLTHLGQGTQRAEDELLRKFPNLRLARMDSDSMRDAIDYQRTLQKFADGGLDVIIGTQMIAKGLDFPNVALVGVLNSDLAMTAPDFRAAERTFQLVCQVAGRSGRAKERGVVVVQTYQPQEPAIMHACNHDYEAFVGGELAHRKEFGYPPFGRMVRLVLSHKQHERVTQDAELLMRNIQAIASRYALQIRWHGPQPPPMERLVELYRSEIILFAQSAVPLQKLLAVLRQRQVFTRLASASVVDVDPVHLS